MTLKIGHKLYLGFGVGILFLVMSGIGIWIYSSNVTANNEGQSRNMRGTVELANIERAMWSLRFGIANYPGADDAGRAKIMADEATFYGDMKHALDAYGSLEHLTAQQTQDLGSMKETISKYIESRPKWFELFNAGKLDEAKEWRAANTNKYGAETVKEIKDLITLQQTINVESEKTTAENTRAIKMVILSFVILATLIAMVLGYLITRNLLKQLGGEPDYAAAIARQIAAGDLTVTIETHPDDQSSLLFALKHMNESLAALVEEVRSSTDSITSAALEVAEGNSDLSQRTEEQASSLQETASSMEELTSTVRQNAENAMQANQLAANASNVAMRGGQVVSEAVHTMASINTSSKRIVDIISVIEGIAFQTNILALNAAVEAARAGEQGKGFAVVASEVRNLAQRSAAAAKEIKSLIDDSVQNVDIGAKQVDQAGTTMNDIVAAVKRVTDIMSEIAAASKEQGAGIEQVNQAITQMDTVTQQNAALVEEAAAAAEAMQGQAGTLTEVVSKFKLKNGNRGMWTASANPTAKLATAPSIGPVVAPFRMKRRLIKAKPVNEGDWKEF